MRISVIVLAVLLGAAAGAVVDESAQRYLPIGSRDDAPIKNGDNGSSPFSAQREGRLIAVSANVAKQLGIEITTAQPGLVASELRLVGTIGFNEEKLARLAPRVSGTVRQVLKNVGDHIESGEPLAILDSKEIAEARLAYFAAKDKMGLAETTFAREDELFGKRVSSEQDLTNARRDLVQARTDMRIAMQALTSMGFRVSDLQQLEASPNDLSRIDIVAPFAGEVIERQLFTGEFLPQDRPVFLVADLDTVWVNLQIAPSQLRYITSGELVRISDTDGPSADAKIVYVAPLISGDTKTALARIELPNPKHRWRPGAMVQALIDGPSKAAAVIVPNDALQTIGGQPCVFLATDGGFRSRVVTTGSVNDKVTEILDGLNPGDRIAAGQTFALKSESEKGVGEDND